LRKANVDFRIYAGDHFPNVAILKGISVYDAISEYEDFSDDLHDGYDVPYTFIEPHYAVTNPLDDQFYDGNSQHPRGSVAAGERFIKSVYETIRNSPVWESSLLVVTYDEAGGFYDHVLPPQAVPTGKRGKFHGFMFDHLGTRVPAIVISPLIPKHVVEHRVLEHSVIPATIEQLFDVESLTARDGSAVGLQTLATLKSPRSDTPTSLDDVVTAASHAAGGAGSHPALVLSPSDPLSSVPGDNLMPALQVAAVEHMAAFPDQKDEIRARVAAIKTLGEYQTYMQEVSAIVGKKRAEARGMRLEIRERSVSPQLPEPVA
jgi:phospholipase C